MLQLLQLNVPPKEGDTLVQWENDISSVEIDTTINAFYLPDILFLFHMIRLR